MAQRYSLFIIIFTKGSRFADGRYENVKETLLSGGYDSVLKEVYLYDDCLAQQRKRYADVIDSFINLFGADRIGGLYSAPGRTEIWRQSHRS